MHRFFTSDACPDFHNHNQPKENHVNTLYNLGAIFNSQQRGVIKRLDVEQAAKRLKMPQHILKQAFRNGTDGGYIQYEWLTSRNGRKSLVHYVLESELEALQKAIESHKAGPVKSLVVDTNYINMSTVAKRLGMKPADLSAWKAYYAKHWPVAPVVDGAEHLYPETIVEQLSTIMATIKANKGKRVNKSDANVTISTPETPLSPAPVVEPTIHELDARKAAETPEALKVEEVAAVDGLTWTDVAVELANEQPQAALWVLLNKVKVA